MNFRRVLEVTGARLVAGDPTRTLTGVSTDTRRLEPGQLFLALSGPSFDGNRFAAEAARRGAGGLLLREGGAELPATDAPVALVPDPARALSELAADHRRRLDARVVGITGSCGKTTTKNMLVELCRAHRRTVGSPASFNNHIGVPLSLLAAGPDAEVAVLELGTSGPGEIAALCRVARPDAGVLTGVGAAHLQGLGSLEGVAEEKGALVEAVDPAGFVVLNADCRFTPSVRRRARARVLTFGLEHEADLTASGLEFRADGTRFVLGGGIPNGEHEVRLPLLGQHMVQNLLAALGAGLGLGLTLDRLLPGVPRLSDGRGRLERVEAGGVLVLDDSYNANPESARASVRTLAALSGRARRALVLGEMHELGARSDELHRRVGEDVADAGLELFVTVGPRARAAADGALRAGLPAGRVHAVDDRDAAADVLLERLEEGDAVLVKGSRVAGLEALVERIRAARAPAET